MTTKRGLIRCATFWGKSLPFRGTFWKHLQRCVLFTGKEYKLGCEAVMKVRGDDQLEGAHSLCHFLRQISSFSGDFLKTLTEMASIHWVDVQTWLQSSHAGKRWWHPRGGSFVVTLFKANLFLFGGLFENTYRDGFNTLGRCTNLAAKQPWRY